MTKHKDRKSIYAAAVSCATTSFWKKTDEEFREIDPVLYDVTPRFTTTKENPLEFCHKNILLSAAHHFKKYPNVREDIHIEDDVLVFIDSGGFQLGSGALKESEWNSKLALDYSERNGNIFPILDRPVANAKNTSDVERCMKLTAESAKYYYENRTRSDRSILNVLSAKATTAMQPWYDAVKEYELDGWAHGGAFGNLKTYLKGMLFLLRKGEYDKEAVKYHHVFGVSGTDAIIYFAVVQQCLNDMGIDLQLTFDSSYFQRNLAFGGFFLFPNYTGMRQIKMSNRYDYDHMADNAGMICNCSVCSHIPDLKSWALTPMAFYLMGIQHNLKLMVDYKFTVDNIIAMRNPEAEKSTFPANIYKNINYIRKAFANPEHGDYMIDKMSTADSKSEIQSLDEFF